MIMLQRVAWADQCKALAIFFMVLLHYGFPYKEEVTFIGMFHMPIFFFISGYFDKGTPFNQEILLKNLKTLMVPYFFFSILAFSICWVSPYLHPELYNNDDIVKTFFKAFVGMFLMEDRVRFYAFMPSGPLWFLVSLFEIRIVFSFLSRIRVKLNCFLEVTTFLLLVLVGIYFPIRYFSIDCAAMAFPIYIAGYIAKQIDIINRISKKWMSMLLFATGFIYLIFFGMNNGNVGIDGTCYGNSMIMFYVNAIIGSLTFIFLFKAIDVKWRWLSIVGAATLTILGTHGYVGIAGKAFGSLFLNIEMSNEPLWFVLSLSAIGIAFGVICHKLLMKYVPFVLGRS